MKYDIEIRLRVPPVPDGWSKMGFALAVIMPDVAEAWLLFMLRQVRHHIDEMFFQAFHKMPNVGRRSLKEL